MLILTLSSDVLREKQMCSWSSPPDFQNPSTNGIAQPVQSEIFKTTTSMGQWDVDFFLQCQADWAFCLSTVCALELQTTNELPPSTNPKTLHNTNPPALDFAVNGTVSVAETCHRKKGKKLECRLLVLMTNRSTRNELSNPQDSLLAIYLNVL